MSLLPGEKGGLVSKPVILGALLQYLVRHLFTSPHWEWQVWCPSSAILVSVSHMMLSRALVLCLALAALTRGAPNIPRSYLPPAADPPAPAPDCRTLTEEQEQEVQEEECSVKEVEICDAGTIIQKLMQ